MPEAFHTTIVSQAEMMAYHDPQRIEAYCQACDRYARYWSCPPFATPPLDQLPAWTHAILVIRKTSVAPDASRDDLIRLFLDAQQTLSALMSPCEQAGSTLVIAGHCFGCSNCTRGKGFDCCAPERMRYSLEALGFDITGLAQGLAGETVEWPKEGPPETLMAVAALLCPSLETARRLDACLGDQTPLASAPARSGR